MKKIWFNDYTVETITDTMGTDVADKHILGALGIELTEIGDDYLKGTMPVDGRTHQIHGILHGGATCVLAETIGSIASILCVDPSKYYAVGSMITANHLRSVSEGHVIATARAVHIGRTKHVWDILVHSDQGKLIAKCELTCAVVPHKK